MGNLAPIILFVYNRPRHTKMTLDALARNPLAKDSVLFIFSDHAKSDKHLSEVQEVRKLVASAGGFKKIYIKKEPENKGLANSIIDGVTAVLTRYRAAIVLEDDIVTSPYFLHFMNGALSYFYETKKIWSISAWNYPIDTKGLNDIFLWRVMNCWGWATWQDRWCYYTKNTKKLLKEFSKNDIHRFNLDGSHNWFGQVLANKKGIINTWAIYWYATIFQNEGLCVNPSQTFTRNIGLDGTGIHCGETDVFESEMNNKIDINFDEPIVENALAVMKVIKFLTLMQ